MTLKDDRYLVVSPSEEEVENYFVEFFGKYLLYTPNVDGREDFIIPESKFKKLN